MIRIGMLILLLSLAVPALASTHKELYANVPCSELWPALKDTLRNSGKYGIIGIDNTEMTASYNIGGNLTGKRINSAVLNSKDNGTSCELQVQTAYSGLINNDAGDLKKRVDESMAKLKTSPPPPAPGAPAASATPAPVAGASLAIDSTPAGADIEIDGAFVGNTPSTVAVAPGSHQIGGTIHLNAELEQVPAK